MKNYMKKWLAGLLAVVIMIGMMDVQALAGTNTSVPTAEVMSDNSKCVNKVEDSGIEYYYKWTATKSGVVNFSLGREDMTVTDNAGWHVYIYDQRMNQFDNGWCVDAYTSLLFTVQPGDTYFLKVSGATGSYTEVSYYVMANFKSMKYVEKESNDTGSSATKLEISKEYVGLMSSDSDVDYYKLTAKQNGYFTLNFDRYEYTTTDNARWYFTVYDSKLNKLFELNTDENKEGLAIRYALAKGKSIYIQIRNYSSSKGILYKLKAGFKACNNIEKESNNDFSTANKIKIGTTYYGTLGETTEDYFVVKPSSNSNYKVAFSLSSDIKYGQEVSVYDSAHNLVQSSGKIYKSGSLKFKAKKDKKYYIKVSHADGGFFGGYTLGALYKMKVSKVK